MDATVQGDHSRSELHRSFQLSRTINSLLERARLRAGYGGPELSIAGFLEAASEGASAERSAEAVAVRLFDEARRQGVFHKLTISTPPPTDPTLSVGIWQAFEEATELRKRTGGIDDYIGLRHVLFAIFTSERDALAEETLEVLRAANLDRSLAVVEIATFCVNQRDSEESFDEWQKILEPLKLSYLIPSAPPSQPSPPPSRPSPPPSQTMDVDEGEPALTPATVPPEPQDETTIAFARLGNDNPDAETLDDKLGVKDEAGAFARVAAARQVTPPLAFGIFGDWGSGKSFFMRLIKKYVDELQDPETDEAKTGLFHQNIVQIRFNAWHYVDSNLWASLVDYIFSELDRWVLGRPQRGDQTPYLTIWRRRVI
jgi:hypothetical protein